jgi:hypothetical protein
MQLVGKSLHLSASDLVGHLNCLSLLKKVFDFGIERPMIVTGNSLSGETSLGHGRDLAIMNGLWAFAH